MVNSPGRLAMGSLTFLLHLAAGVCALVLLVSFCTAFYAGLLVHARIGLPEPGERKLGWGERAGHGAARFNRFLVDDEFRSLRRLYFGAWTVVVASFGLLSLLVLIGTRI